MLDLRLLGAVELRGNRTDGTPVDLTQPKRLALLMYLAVAEPEGLHARDRLLAMLWPEADDASSRHSLRNALHALRQALGERAILTRGEGWVGLDFSAIRCDVRELRTHLAAGRVDEAVALWTGDLAPGFHLHGAPDFDRWLEEQRRALGRAVRAVAWTRARELEGGGATELEAIRRAVRLDPGNEPGVRQLMQLLAAVGDRGGALQAYQELVEWLAHEVEEEPSAETRALERQVRANATPPVAAASTQATAAAPQLATPLSTTDTENPPLSPDSSLPQRPRPTTRLIMRWATAFTVIAAAAVGGRMYVSRSQRSSQHRASEAELALHRLPARFRTDTGAYSSYLRGLTLRFQFRFKESRDTLSALVDRKPLYVPGLCALANAWIFTTLNYLTDPDESWPRIDALARRALALDSTAANAWLALAAEDMFAHRDLPRAGERITRASRLDPLEPDAAGMRSVWFRFHGEMDSAIAQAQLAHRLDPLSLFFERLVGKQLFFARHYEESRRAYMRMLQESPGWARGYEDLSELSVARGHPAEAVEWLRLARVAQGDSAGAAALGTVTTDGAADRLLNADARRRLARLDSAALAGDRTTADGHATAFASLGDTTATLQWLDSMLVQNNSYVHQVRVDPVFDFLRDDPRYEQWELRSGLPPMRSELRDRLRASRRQASSAPLRAARIYPPRSTSIGSSRDARRAGT